MLQKHATNAAVNISGYVASNIGITSN